MCGVLFDLFVAAVVYRYTRTEPQILVALRDIISVYNHFWEVRAHSTCGTSWNNRKSSDKRERPNPSSQLQFGSNPPDT